MAGLASLSSLTQKMTSTLNDNRVGFNIVTLNEDGKPIAQLSLQYFPESLQDNKSVSYATRSVPGGSLPIYQWISGGPRRISLKAVFTRDMDPESDTIPGSSTASQSTRYKNVDIRSAIVWLRSHIYPSYKGGASGEGAGSSVALPNTLGPRQVILNIPNSGIGLFSGNLTQDSVLAYMMECGVEYVSFFPNGIPRIVHVNLAFEETAQYKGVVNFPQTTPRIDGLWGTYGQLDAIKAGFGLYSGNKAVKFYSITKNMPSVAAITGK